MNNMDNNEIFKFNSYLRVIAEYTGYDFSGYSFESLNRRLEHFISSECIGSADELKDKLFLSNISQDNMLGNLLVNYSEIFRDPEFFKSLRTNVLPYLSTYSTIYIWHAGCSTGEEVYSLAILLDELDLLSRCEIYATDVNEMNLKNASRGIFPLAQMQESSSRYLRAGGKNNLSNYYTAYYDSIIFHKHLRDKIKFTIHNLIYDKPFCNAHLILCRNVFIYFDEAFQQKALSSLCNNLHNYGYLGMGVKESFVNIRNSNFSVIDQENKIFRKVI
jgi:chemotaxis protein methyltransferase CheR